MTDDNNDLAEALALEDALDELPDGPYAQAMLREENEALALAMAKLERSKRPNPYTRMTQLVAERLSALGKDVSKPFDSFAHGIARALAQPGAAPLAADTLPEVADVELVPLGENSSIRLSIIRGDLVLQLAVENPSDVEGKPLLLDSDHRVIESELRGPGIWWFNLGQVKNAGAKLYTLSFTYRGDEHQYDFPEPDA